jgi:hypothetical protein
MKYAVVVLVALCSFAGANPVLETIVSEVGFHADGSAWLELTWAPLPGPPSLDNWGIVTSTSDCVLHCSFGPEGYVVIDSAGLATGELGTGTFRLDPVSDSIRIYNNNSSFPLFERLGYGPGSTEPPPPSQQASAARLNQSGGGTQSISWWADSTPTPGEPNDDFGVIIGSVRGDHGEVPIEVYVYADGPSGHVAACGWQGRTWYVMRGLAPGTYQLSSQAWFAGWIGWAFWPESVTVGYSDTVNGVNFVFVLDAVTERGAATGGGAARGGPAMTYDAQGRRVNEPVRAGVYFVRPSPGAPVRKVVIAR